MTQKMGLMPSKNEISLLRPAINEWRPKNWTQIFSYAKLLKRCFQAPLLRCLTNLDHQSPLLIFGVKFHYNII